MNEYRVFTNVLHDINARGFKTIRIQYTYTTRNKEIFLKLHMIFLCSTFN